MQKTMFLVLAGFGLLVGSCASIEREPVGPVSEESDMPWNTPRPGEGGAAFGGLLGEGR